MVVNLDQFLVVRNQKHHHHHHRIIITKHVKLTIIFKNKVSVVMFWPPLATGSWTGSWKFLTKECVQSNTLFNFQTTRGPLHCLPLLCKGKHVILSVCKWLSASAVILDCWYVLCNDFMAHTGYWIVIGVRSSISVVECCIVCVFFLLCALVLAGCI